MEEKPFKATAKSLSPHDLVRSGSKSDIRNLWTKATLSQPKLNVQLTNVYEDSDQEDSGESRRAGQWYKQKADDSRAPGSAGVRGTRRRHLAGGTRGPPLGAGAEPQGLPEKRWRRGRGFREQDGSVRLPPAVGALRAGGWLARASMSVGVERWEAAGSKFLGEEGRGRESETSISCLLHTPYWGCACNQDLASSVSSLNILKHTHHRAYWVEQQNRLPLPLMELMENEALEILTKALQSYRSAIGKDHFLTRQLQRYIEGLKKRQNRRQHVSAN
ncbi:hypothetical protein QTO34_003289 [Cnephaeus nilssonii]|uniref:Catsper channel auxiliary subunit zeta n=1 Tax=Cnephaeus nilssonii TaxID=3371016 RepID=A0AA40LL11_CNENI|nr:hypothetical protein QTO34_003289 [Eptesicus nilssonii]